MPSIAPTLLLLALSIVATAADAGIDRVVRTQEGVQRGVATLAEQTAAKADLLADNMRFNRVGDESDADRLDNLASELKALVRSPEADTKTMSYVVDRLARARRGEAGELVSAAEAQKQLVGQLERITTVAAGRLAGADGLNDLRAAIDAQRRVQGETGKLADQTLGKERAELSTTEKSDLERLARQQQNLDKAIDEAAQSLREQAKAAESERDRINLNAAADELEKGQAADESKKAAEALRENRLAEAQEAQDRVMQRLEEAERLASGATRDVLAELDRKMQQLEEARRDQQQLLDETRAENDLSKTEADRLAAKQQDIARALDELAKSDQQQLQKAAEIADQAKDALQQQDKAGAEQKMEQALAEMSAAQQDLQQQRQAAQAAQDQQRQESAEQQLAMMEQQAQALEEAAQQQQALMDQLAQLPGDQISQPQAQQMSTQQQDIANQMQRAQQQQAQQAAQQAKQSLDQQNRPQAQQQMQQALQAMQQAQQQMQQQIALAKQKMPPGKPQMTTEPQAQDPSQQAGTIEDGERGGFRRSGWNVSMDPGEREVLSQVKAEEFPARYEQALVQYYRALAGEGDK